MSGGAAVIEAIGAIAAAGAAGARHRRGRARPRTCPSGRSMKPGDIVRASNGTTVEIINTDAEGRLVLSDCLVHAQAQGAERLVDLATLTGAMRRGARLDLRGADGQRRRVGRRGVRRRALVGRARVAAAAARRVRRRDQEPLRGHHERGRDPQGGRDHGRGVPARASPATRRGRTSTSPGWRGTAARPTRPRAATGSASGCSWSSHVAWRRDELRPRRRHAAAAAHGPRVRGPGGQARSRGAGSHEGVPLRARAQDGRARLDGDPVPGGGRRRRRHVAAVRDRGRGAHAHRLLGGDHDVRAHLAGHAAGLPVRLRGAEAAAAAGPDRGAQARARSG